ncbi:hypothetical protein IWW38_000353 [Coemansia aciculifera]|uniref:Uncharacterized protein n=1 Tax=Coemansia aciculifera TaxID=417176 RepID=A0ACC1MA78_9FUNG|nr:hypothetical protein IWW38_000353 [Coemansia aciculifera]
MRFSSSVLALTLASFVTAAPLVRRDQWNDMVFGGFNSPVVYHPGSHFPGFPGDGYPQGGWNHGGGGGGFPPGNGGGFPPGNGGGNPPGNGGGNPPGNGGGGNPPGNGGGGNPPGNGGGNPPGNGGGNPPGNGGGNPPGNGGGNPPGNGGGGTPPGGGGSGGKNVCGVSPNQISALTPLLNKLGLSTTVDGVKQLVDKLLLSTGGLLESPGVNGSGGVIDLVNNLVKGLLGQPLDLHNTVDAVTEILEKQVPCLLDTVLPKP